MSKPNVYPINPALSFQYHGAGWGLAAITEGQVNSIRYIRDVAPKTIVDQVEMGEGHASFYINQWLSTAEAGPVIRELQARGKVSVGMFSSWEFVEM